MEECCRKTDDIAIADCKKRIHGAAIGYIADYADEGIARSAIELGVAAAAAKTGRWGAVAGAVLGVDAIANAVITVEKVKGIAQAAEAAKKEYCVCPPKS